jgi:hypothetical protein
MKFKKSIVYVLTFAILASMILASSLFVSAQSVYGDSFDPGIFTRGEWSSYNLGNEFVTNIDGNVTVLRGYVFEDAVGTHYVSLYGDIREPGTDDAFEATLLARVKFEARGEAGWINIPLDAPVFLPAGTYVVSLTTSLTESGGNLFAFITQEDSTPKGDTNLQYIRGRHEGWDLDPDWIPFPGNDWQKTRLRRT